MDFTPQQEDYHKADQQTRDSSRPDFPEDTESDSERADLKAHLLESDKYTRDYLALEARLIGKFGPAAGVFMRQVIFWTGKGATPEGWIYKSVEEMHRETGLSPRQQRAARKVLTAKGVLEEHRPSRRRPLYFRARLGPLMDILEPREADDVDVLFDDVPVLDDLGEEARNDDPDDPLVLENEYEHQGGHTQSERLRGHTQYEHQGEHTESERFSVATTENTPQSTAIEDERESALQAALSRAARGFAQISKEKTSTESTTSPLPLQPDVEPDSAKEESTSEAPPLSPEVERDLAARVRKIVLTERGLKDAALKKHRDGRVEDVAEYVRPELGEIGAKATSAQLVRVVGAMLAKLEEEAVA